MKNEIALFIATWFYSGLIPSPFKNEMAGTYGSFFAIPLCYVLISTKDPLIIFFALVFLISIGLWSVHFAQDTLGPRKDWKGIIKNRDQNQIVIDEVVGMAISCIPIIYKFSGMGDWYLFLIAFAVFRFFDIVKISPSRYFDKQKNSFGIIMDDVIAGLQTLLVMIPIVYLLR